MYEAFLPTSNTAVGTGFVVQRGRMRGNMLSAMPRLAVILANCVAGAPWGYTRLGPPMLDLSNFTMSVIEVLEGGLPQPKPPPCDAEPPAGLGDVERALANAVADNGLQLNTNTLANGDCGPDAILLNLERLALQNPQAQRILNTLQARGRQAALHCIRLMLLIWVRDHTSLEVVPGVTLATWIQMEGYAGSGVWRTGRKRGLCPPNPEEFSCCHKWMFGLLLGSFPF